MAEPNRWRRALTRALLGLLALTALLLVAGRLYLSSSAAVGLVTGAVESQLKTRVEMASVSIGTFGATDATGLRVYEPGTDQVVLEADRVKLDVSAWSALWGRRSPRRLDLDGAHLRLRFDRDNKLLTRLPAFEGGEGPTPALQFTAASVTIEKEGREAFTVSGIQLATAEGASDGVALKGTVNDPYWGQWGASLIQARAPDTLTLELNSTNSQVDQKKLEALPFVPKNVWDQVKAQGRTPVMLRVRLGPKDDVHYRVELRPRAATVTVPAIDLTFTNTQGQVTIEDNRLQLDRVTGEVAGGQVETTSKMDFTGDDSLLRFQVDASGARLQKLPVKQWKLPARIDGKVLLKGLIVVKVGKDGTVSYDGSDAEARIADPKLGEGANAVPIEKLELEFDLKGRNDRLRFTPKAAKVGALYLPLLVTMAQTQPPPPTLPSPDRLASTLTQGVTALARGVADGASSVIRQVERIARKRKPTEPVTYLTARISLKDVDVANLLKQLEVAAPVQLGGRLSVQVQVGIPLNDARELRLYRLTGTASSSRLEVEGVELRRLEARVSFADGILRLTSLRGEVPQPDGQGEVGSFHGFARLGVDPPGTGTVDLQLLRLPLRPLTALVPALGKELSGEMSGRVRASAAYARLGRPEAWRGVARLVRSRLSGIGLEVRDLSAVATAEAGQVTVSDLRGSAFKGALTGSGTLTLKGDQPFRATLEIAGAELAQLQPAVAPKEGLTLGGRADVTANLSGTLQPLKWSGSGTATAKDLRVAGTKAGAASVKWSLAPDKLRLTGLKATLYEGELTGSAEVPLEGAAGTLDLKVKGLDAGALLKSNGVQSLRIEGKITGNAKGTFRLPSGGKPLSLDGNVDLTATRLRVQGIAAERLKGKLQYKDGKGLYDLEGEALGGKFSVEGKFPPPVRGSVGEQHGRLRVERLFVGRLARELGLGDRARSLRGVASLDLPFRFDGPDREPVGRGRVLVRDLRWGGNELADDIRGDITLSPERLMIRNLGGGLAGGTLSLRGSVGLGKAPRGWFNLSLNGVEVSQLMAFDEEVAKALKGRIDIRLRGSRAGGEWRASGAALLRRGQVMGVAVNDLRVPLDVSFAPDRGRAELNVRDSTAQVGSGRAQLRTELIWGDGARLEGRLRLFDANASSLAGAASDLSSYARGRVTGTVDFGASNLRSVNDLTANVQATLKETQAFQLPVLNLLVPYLAPGRGALTFNEGDLKARLSGGVLRISKLTLASQFIEVVLDGTLTLSSGRLDLQAVGRTSSLPTNAVALRLIARQIPAVGPVPVGLIVRATELLSDRVVYLRISGTLKSPSVRVEPLRQLSEEAVRFLIRQLIPVPGTR